MIVRHTRVLFYLLVLTCTCTGLDIKGSRPVCRSLNCCHLLAAWVVDLFVILPMFVQPVLELVESFCPDYIDRKFIPVVDDTVC